MYYIYEIYNDVTQRRYIGQTQYYGRRFNQHIYNLKAGKHTAENMQADAITYGVEHFFLRIIDTAKTKEEALSKETRYIRRFNTYVPDKGYNGYDSRFLSIKPVKKLPDTDLAKKIKSQGYSFHKLSWMLKISYRVFAVKLNNPELFTDEEREKLNEYISISSRERWKRSFEKIRKEKDYGEGFRFNWAKIQQIKSC